MEIAELRELSANEAWFDMWDHGWWTSDDASYIAEHIPFDVNWRMMIASHCVSKMMEAETMVWEWHPRSLSFSLPNEHLRCFVFDLILWVFDTAHRERIHVDDAALRAIEHKSATPGYLYIEGNIREARQELLKVTQGIDNEAYGSWEPFVDTVAREASRIVHSAAYAASFEDSLHMQRAMRLSWLAVAACNSVQYYPKDRKEYRDIVDSIIPDAKAHIMNMLAKHLIEGD